MTDWTTRLIHPDTRPPEGFRSLVPPVHRGSTVVFSSTAEVSDDWHHKDGYTYGLYGTPTARDLAGRIAALEGGHYTFITPGGQAAIALISFAFTRAGDHALIPDSAYGPTRQFADDVLARFGVEVETYAPGLGGEIEGRMRANTRLVWCESPGSATMEVQDVPAIARAAHRHGAVVALDNTYAAGVYFDAFAHGVDVTMQALTKYVGGHSDLLLGSVTARTEAEYEALGLMHARLGLGASPDDCSLALRGMQTLGVRLAALERGTLQVARWLARHPAVETVLHPALPSCPGHALWQRDFTGSTSVFSIVLAAPATRGQVAAFVDGLRWFEIGYSWGGVTSLAVPFFDLHRTHGPAYDGRLVRLNVGLEHPDDLVADLDQAFRAAGLPASPAPLAGASDGSG
ncbi:cystathionine beta-lyase [Longimicrobium sp.]|uniref:cystathionine beta-lyase n=1 Tax=Longimicrobium sp. TaxID=2029185 RepID=UPI002E300777|nr:cystathionine beta-lyase [Longimicrobium sp.]HEX6037661.1 cystathionine beta-lyase [Longimicrobium sp.]